MPGFAGEAKYVWDWSGHSPLSYNEFLQARRFERSLRVGIREQTQQLIASNQELSALGISVSRETQQGLALISREIGALRESLSEELGAIKDGLTVINSTLNWGFNALLFELGCINDTLAELLRAVRTPSQTWAYEQFEIARDEYRRGLFRESLESAQRAVAGYGSNPGYKTDFRFHFLIGVLHLGDFRNVDPGLVDPAKAENAFLLSARYSRADKRDEAGKALTCAARAAFVQKCYDRARAHGEQALQAFKPWSSDGKTEPGDGFGPNHAPALFLLAKVAASEDRYADASAILVRAMGIDPLLSLAAASDPDFAERPGATFLEHVIESATDHWSKKAERAWAECDHALTRFMSIEIDGRSAMDIAPAEFEQVSILYEQCESRAANTTTLLGYFSEFNDVMSLKERVNGLGSATASAWGHLLSNDLGEAGEGRTRVYIDSSESLGCAFGITVGLLILMGMIGMIRIDLIGFTGFFIMIAVIFGVSLASVVGWSHSRQQSEVDGRKRRIGRLNRAKDQVYSELGSKLWP